MSVLETIKAQWLAARRERRTVEATLLGTLVGAVQSKEKTFNPARPITDAEVLAEVKKLLDGVVEMTAILSMTNRTDALEKSATEKRVLEGFMPAQMTEIQIETLVREQAANGLEMGAIMAYLKNNHAGQYDGKLAAVITRRVLST